MAKKQNDIQVVEEYLEVLNDEVSLRFDNPTSKDTIRHLIEKGIISPKTLRNYMIIYDFDTILEFNEGNRTHTFMDISIKYEISERQAQTIVYKERKKQEISSNITY
jgi:hypothetical protein